TLGALDRAQAVADKMLLHDPLVRARGRFRIAQIAILEGRLAAAYDTLRIALAENRPLGLEGETTQGLISLRALAPIAGAAGDERRYARELADAFTSFGFLGNAASYGYEADLLDAPGQCPAIEPRLARVPDQQRSTVRRRFARSAAIAGCGSCKDAVAEGL